MKTRETIQMEILEIIIVIEKLEIKQFDDLNDADKRNLNRNLEELKLKVKIAESELKNIK